MSSILIRLTASTLAAVLEIGENSINYAESQLNEGDLRLIYFSRNAYVIMNVFNYS
jgi:hypothetical protein